MAELGQVLGFELPQESCLDCLDFSSKLPRLTDNAKDAIAELLLPTEVLSCLMVRSAIYTRQSTSIWLLVGRWQFESCQAINEIHARVVKLAQDIVEVGRSNSYTQRTRKLRLKQMIPILEHIRKQMLDSIARHASILAVPGVSQAQCKFANQLQNTSQAMSDMVSDTLQILLEFMA